MGEILGENERDLRVVWSDAPIICGEDGVIDGELMVLSSTLVNNYNGKDGTHREDVVRQIPSNIILGET